MGAKFALTPPPGVLAAPEIRRYAGPIEAVAGLIGALVAGLLLMAPLDLGGGSDIPVYQLDLMVLNVPRAAAAGAAFAVVSAALVSALGRRSAWVASFGSLAVLLADHLWNRDVATEGTLTTVNYIDSMFSGILMGALAVAVFGRPLATNSYLAGALAGILIGDQTSLPGSGGGNPLTAWASDSTPPVWLMLLAGLALALATALQRTEATGEEENTDIAIGPILAALVLVTSTAVSTDWLVRHGGTPTQIGVAAAITITAAVVAALLLPGRDGVLVLLTVAAANAGSAIIAVPRPEWTAPFPIIAVVVGLIIGRCAPSIRVAAVATAALSVFAACTATTAHSTAVIPVLGITLTALIIGYCFGSAIPEQAGSAVVAIAVLIVPCLIVAVRGSSFGRVAYSPRWYRDPQGVTSAVPGWMALVITVGCAAGMLLLWRIRAARNDYRPKRELTQASASA